MHDTRCTLHALCKRSVIEIETEMANNTLHSRHQREGKIQIKHHSKGRQCTSSRQLPKNLRTVPTPANGDSKPSITVAEEKT